MTLAGEREKLYTVTIVAETTGSDGSLTEETSFSVTFKNPCIDPDFVTIEVADLPINLSYTLTDRP